MLLKMQEGLFATSQNEIPYFQSSNSIVTCFIEYLEEILILKRAEKGNHPNKWCTPGGKCEINETFEKAIIREVWEETKIDVLGLKTFTKCYIRTIPSNQDYLFGVFRISLKEKPQVYLDFSEHQESRWIANDDFGTLNLLPFQKEIFQMIYSPTCSK